MAVLEWSGALALELPAMDEVHQEFVLLLAEVEAADDAQLCARWDELIAHTQVHFDQEDRWMQSTRFTSTNCHSLQHKVVMQVRSEEHTSELQSQSNLVCRLLLEKKKKITTRESLHA